jgi:WD40 repeat protein
MPSSSTSTSPGFLLSASKDTFLKLWDLSTQHCAQTIVAHRMEIWTVDLDREKRLLFTGSGEGELKVWQIDLEALQDGIKESADGEVCIKKKNRQPTLAHPKDSWSNSLHPCQCCHCPPVIEYHKSLSIRLCHTLPCSHMTGPSKSSGSGQKRKHAKSNCVDVSEPRKRTRRARKVKKRLQQSKRILPRPTSKS